jgi:hypothetical protein
MSWDYKNPLPPKSGDERYNTKFPETYQVLDCIREHYYDVFNGDLAFNGNPWKEEFGCPETAIFTYDHQSKSFASIRDKKPVFTVRLEKGTLADNSNYVEFELKKSILELDNPELLLEFMRKSMQDIVGRNFNLVLSRNGSFKFIHIPFDKEVIGAHSFSNGNKTCYSNEEAGAFIDNLYDNQYFYMNMVSPDITSRFGEDELAWFQQLRSLGDTLYASNYQETRNIEIGPGLEYIKLNKA